MENYGKNFDRRTKAGCRIVVKTTLNETLTILVSLQNYRQYLKHIQSHQKGNDGNSKSRQSSNPPHTIFQDQSVLRGIVLAPSVKSRAIVVNGRVDLGIGHTLHSTQDPAKRRFQSPLLIVEAKRTYNLSGAVVQLVVYLDSLHQSRLLSK